MITITWKRVTPQYGPELWTAQLGGVKVATVIPGQDGKGWIARVALPGLIGVERAVFSVAKAFVEKSIEDWCLRAGVN